MDLLAFISRSGKGVLIISLAAFISLSLSGCDGLRDFANLPLFSPRPSPTPETPLPDSLTTAIQSIPGQVDEIAPRLLREDAAEMLRAITGGPAAAESFPAYMIDRITIDASEFLDEARIEDTLLLEHDVELVQNLLAAILEEGVPDRDVEILQEALAKLVQADYQIILISAADAELVVRSAQSAGEELSDVGIQAAETELERTRSGLQILNGTLRKGELRGALNLFVPVWESSAAVRTVWGLHYEGDYDEDGVGELLELSLGSSPFVHDSDGDGLSDYYEVYHTAPQAMPGLADTDGDGIFDGDEDLDLDGVSNLMERDLGTDPLLIDTNGDGLSDMAVVLGVEMGAITGDSDGDGLSDESEERLGTNVLHVDSDGDGTPDGQEFHSQFFDYPNLGLKVVLFGMGDHFSEFQAEGMVGAPGYAGNFGQVGNFIRLSTGLPYASGIISLVYDEAIVPAGDEANLRLFVYDEELGEMIMLENPSVDFENNVVQGETHKLGPIGIIYLPIWNAVTPQ
jgi:hypothetical protein